MIKFLEVDFWNAAANWVNWRLDYECPMDRNLPVLADKARFKKFLSEYSVLMGEKNEQRQSLRVHLAGGFQTTSDAEGLARDWFDDPHLSLSKKHVSFATKIMTFRDPTVYFPMDSLNKIGLPIADGLGPVTEYDNFLSRVDVLLKKEGQTAEELEKFLSSYPPVTSNNIAFQRRVFDHCLMRIGRKP